MSRLADRVLAVHAALEEAGLPHAFGGAIALAYCTHEPRGTRDIDVNVFVEPGRADGVLDAMPRGIRVGRSERAALRRDGQVRVHWDDTPVDLFLETHAFHEEVAAGVTEVPFEGVTIPVLGCSALVVFKALFNRTRDWGDIEAVLDAGTVVGRAALERLRELVGPGDPAAVRLAALVEAR